MSLDVATTAHSRPGSLRFRQESYQFQVIDSEPEIVVMVDVDKVS